MTYSQVDGCTVLSQGTVLASGVGAGRMVAKVRTSHVITLGAVARIVGLAVAALGWSVQQPPTGQDRRGSLGAPPWVRPSGFHASRFALAYRLLVFDAVDSAML